MFLKIGNHSSMKGSLLKEIRNVKAIIFARVEWAYLGVFWTCNYESPNVDLPDAAFAPRGKLGH
jgi:hypothetical protein